MHVLFKHFDAAVCARGLFKMDTIGDAYICAGFFPAESSDVVAKYQQAKVCKELLAVAADMLWATEELSWPVGASGACRIGISFGSVIAGALGQLQPRSVTFSTEFLTIDGFVLVATTAFQ